MIRLALRCNASESEVVLAELLELAPGGVEEVRDPDGLEGVVEYAVYGAAGEVPELGQLHAAAGGALVELRSEPVPDDWGERWKRFYHPLLIGGRLYVRPPWERAAERGGVIEVVIDPGRAFGTGTHATTSMCMELLLDAARGGTPRPLRHGSSRLGSLCDLGCGSGVLAIAAAKLGFAPVIAIDSERAAIEESDRNARRNYVELDLRRVDLRQERPPAADVVTANLTTSLLGDVARAWSGAAAAPRKLIASGFPASEADLVREQLAGAGLRTRRVTSSGDWGALLAEA